MFYNFPIIERIEDVFPAIEGRDEFIIAEREGFTVINYNVGFNDTFTIDANDLMANHGRAIPKGIMRRECRGIIFYPDGRLMSRPFHKFFNVGEREETLLHNIDLSRPHTIMEKMDGSMIRPLSINGKLRLGTKMGVTDTSEAAECWLHDHPNREVLEDWLRVSLIQEWTPLFEFIAPENRIVIEYDKPDLVLLAIRKNSTGDYAPRSNLDCESDNWTIVPEYGSIKGSLDEYVARQREKEGREGDIIAVGNMRYKIKNDWYIRIHEVKDKIRSYRHILSLVLKNRLDDIYPMLDENDFNRVKKYEQDFHDAYHRTLTFLEYEALEALEKAGGDRKLLATEILPKSGLDKSVYRFVFGKADGKDMNEMLMAHVKSRLGSTAKYLELADFLDLETDRGVEDE